MDHVEKVPTKSVVAVSAEEVEQFGCPYCGYRSGSQLVSTNGANLIICGECGRDFLVLGPGAIRSTIRIGKEETVPELVDHPRRGIPSHGQPDVRPDQADGEYLFVRGIGSDTTPGCFICGGPNNLYNNIAAFVTTKAAGERVVTMFKQGARMDYREYEPDRVQVKIGACDTHIANLRWLAHLARGQNVITSSLIEGATVQKFEVT